VVVNAQSGVVFARGMPEELRAVGEYHTQIHDSARRQVVLEAKIIEVTLSDGFQAGVNWAAVQQKANGDTYTGGTLSGGGQIDRPPPLGAPPGHRPGQSSHGFVSQTWAPRSRSRSTWATSTRSSSSYAGRRRVLEPAHATLNNQKAVIKAGTTSLRTDVSNNTVTGTAATRAAT
jgi:MSHA biogenesis protein MshL